MKKPKLALMKEAKNKYRITLQFFDERSGNIEFMNTYPNPMSRSEAEYRLACIGTAFDFQLPSFKTEER